MTNGLLMLRQDTQTISSSIGITRRESKVDQQGEDPPPDVMDTLSASLGLRPEGLPQADAFFLRTHTYDKDRDTTDIVNDFWSLSLKYEPIRDLDLRGNVSHTEQDNKLTDINVERWDYSGRATYSRRFWDRVTAYATYNFNRTETEVTVKGTGVVEFQVFPFSGLSALSDTPVLVPLDPNPALIDGDLAASSGINIGVPPIGGDTRKRNIGIDFINPSEVNLIYIWVERDLPAGVSGTFSWEIYISSDNLNWTLWQTVFAAPFGTFANRFEININRVSARYLKVVTSPLLPGVPVPPGTDVSNIHVTEMQAFLRSPAEDVKREQTLTSHVYDLSMKWRILDRPNLNYDFYYWGARSDPGGDPQYIMTIGLSLTHRFNRVFSGAARISREDGDDGTGKRSANIFSAAVTAAPLPTLFHSIVVSGRFEDGPQGQNDSQSAFLNNTAELYKGLNVNLTGGVSVSNTADDRENVNTIINSGVSVIPNPRLNLSLNYSVSKTESTGGGQEDFTTRSSNSSVSVSYVPFTTLYIYASYGRSDQTDQETSTTQNYVVTWSPFPDGDLQFSFAYLETLSDPDNTKDRTVSPSLRWTMRPNVSLDVAYSNRENKSESQKTVSDTYFATLRMVF
jgi:hypothetical protein